MTTLRDGGQSPAQIPQALQALQNGQDEIGEYLLEQGAEFKRTRDNGDSVGHLAAANNCIASLRLLVKKGLDENLRGAHQTTPLLRAAVNGHVDVIQFLLLNGADAEAEDKDGDTALALAAQAGKTHVVKLLVAHAN